MRFDCERGMIAIAFLLSFIILLSNSSALTLSCSISKTCVYPAVPVAYLQNDTGGFDNAHVQNTSAISLQGLVGWYRLDNMSAIGENASNVFDWSGMGNNGTPSGGAAVNLSGGKLNSAYTFDGINDAISLPNSNTLNLSGEQTISARIRSTMVLSGGQTASIVERGAYGDPRNSLGIRVDTTQVIRFDYEFTTGTNTPSALGTTDIIDGQWHHVVGSWNLTHCLAYTDGILEGTASCPTAPGPFDQAFLIADGTSKSIFFNGSIDDIMIFNRTLSSAEVMNLYNRTFYSYNYAICCNADSVLSTTCSAPGVVNVTKLSNYTNAHLQTGTYSGVTNYTYPACLATSPGRVQCQYSDDSCSAGYVCMGSMASSELADLNMTNSHIGSCDAYRKKICCKLNSPPVANNVILNSTFRTNLTTENLTVYFSQSDPDNDFTTNITDWRINGTSMAIFNLPFNTEENSRALKVIRDYSTFGNNATLSPNITWIANGRSGGAYSFDGIDDFITVNNSISANVTTFSLSIWVNTGVTDCDANNNYRSLVRKHNNVAQASSGFDVVWEQARNPQFDIGNGTHTNRLASGGVAPIGNWTHYVFTYDNATTTSRIYYNGVISATRTTIYGGMVANSNDIYFGRGTNTASCPNGNGHFNGSLDEILFFNRTLSAEQIYELYLAGSNNLSLQKIHFNETFSNENWTCAVTPNDGMDGNTTLSNQLIIRNSAPTVTLTSPADGFLTTNRTPMFNWTGFDPDGDTLTYEINITAFLIPGGTSTCTDVRGATIGPNYYVPPTDLSCLYDNGVYYVWSVRANDGGGYGDWSSTRIINISALQAISLPVNAIDFGDMSVLETNDTTDDAPAPFIVQNDGNSHLDINITASNLWQSVASPNLYYRFKIDNVTGEINAFNWTGSATVFTNASESEIFSIKMLNYSNIKDSAETDVYVQVPGNEPPAARNSTMVFYSYLGER